MNTHAKKIYLLYSDQVNKSCLNDAEKEKVIKDIFSYLTKLRNNVTKRGFVFTHPELEIHKSNLIFSWNNDDLKLIASFNLDNNEVSVNVNMNEVKQYNFFIEKKLDDQFLIDCLDFFYLRTKKNKKRGLKIMTMTIEDEYLESYKENIKYHLSKIGIKENDNEKTNKVFNFLKNLREKCILDGFIWTFPQLSINKNKFVCIWYGYKSKIKIQFNNECNNVSVNVNVNNNDIFYDVEISDMIDDEFYNDLTHLFYLERKNHELTCDLNNFSLEIQKREKRS